MHCLFSNLNFIKTLFSNVVLGKFLYLDMKFLDFFPRGHLFAFYSPKIFSHRNKKEPKQTPKNICKIIAFLSLRQAKRWKGRNFVSKLQLCDCPTTMPVCSWVPAQETWVSQSVWNHSINLPRWRRKPHWRHKENKSIQSREEHSGKQSTNTFLEHGNEK